MYRTDNHFFADQPAEDRLALFDCFYLDAKITEQHKAAIVRVCRAYDMAFDGFPPAGVSCSLTSAIGEWLDSMEEAGVELPLAREA